MQKQQLETFRRIKIGSWIVLGALLMVLAACAGPSSRTGSQGANFQAVSVDPAQRGNVVLTALGLVDTPYRYGGNGPNQGFDCSGLVAYVFDDAVQRRLPHHTASIAKMSRPVSRRQLKAGDFVFFNTLNRPYSHMGIYIGNGQFVNAPSSGGRVRVDSLDNPYFARHFEAAGTLFMQ
ncbi:C40 family peptidase [Allopusillimonas ginsengisoli]|uniref:C40 family peptidase n=1 Tax=Allopusillimonas ginsengisoli TaxID=453575 RepID=UPI00102119B6|nr:C40 family peptidase [Allopusillimonas ginsengisoli]TEA79429.1 peptidoglycan endopeptidase [Allopusillimonas ginsengisoli]